MELTLAMPEPLAQMLDQWLPELMVPMLAVLLGLLCLGVLLRGSQWLFAALEATPFNYEPPEPSLQPQEQ